MYKLKIFPIKLTSGKNMFEKKNRGSQEKNSCASSQRALK